MARRPPEENHSTCRFQRTTLVYAEQAQYGTRHDVNFLGRWTVTVDHTGWNNPSRIDLMCVLHHMMLLTTNYRKTCIFFYQYWSRHATSLQEVNEGSLDQRLVHVLFVRIQHHIYRESSRARMNDRERNVVTQLFPHAYLPHTNK